MLHTILTYTPLLLAIFLFGACCYGARVEPHPDVRGAAAQSGGFILLLGFLFTQGLEGRPLDVALILFVLAFAALSVLIVGASASKHGGAWWRWGFTLVLILATAMAWGAL
ncbi:hypothetical protein DM785_02560 [Deinococcus actinosclerus]|nr:hypothetical protein DM785_02560 [Deinococcus actinosclerus]